MSDYLGHLVERSFAPVPAVRPNTPSRFESAPATSPADKPTEADLTIDSKITPPRPRDGESTENNASRISEAARETNHNAQRQFAGQSFIRAQEKTAAEKSAPVPPFSPIPSLSQNSALAPRQTENPNHSVATPRTIQAFDSAAAFTRGINPEPGFSLEIRPNIATTKETLRPDGSRPVSPVGRKENGQSAAGEISAPSSTIHVTIGRVEIKATPPPPAPARTIRQKNPALSLESYLQRRSNGGRDE